MNEIINFGDGEKVKVIMLKGEAGNDIQSVTKTSTVGLVDTYTITLTDGTTTTFEVTNGRAIVNIEKTSTVGLVDTYTITYSDNTTSTFTVTNGSGASITVDDALSTSSTNPVENKVITAKVNDIESNVSALETSLGEIDDKVDAVQTQIVPLASIETSTTASQSYSVGEFIVLNGVLREVTSAIAQGDTISDSNSEATDVGVEISQIKTGLANNNARLEVVEEEISNLDEVNMILITDSYGIQNSGSSVTKFYPTIVKEKLGLDDDHFKYSAQSGAGFGNGEFLTQLQSIANNMTTEQKNLVTDILVCGGWNDSDKTQSYGTDTAYNNGVDAFDTYIKTAFPNARMNLAMISWGDCKISNSFNASNQIPVAMDRYTNTSADKNWRFLKNCEFILHTYASGIWQSDGNHPAQGGQNLLGKFVAEAFINGVCDIFRYESIINIRSGYSVFVKQHNEVTSITFIPTENSAPYSSFNTTVDLNGTTEFEMFNAQSLTLARLRGGHARISSNCTLTQGGSNALMPVQFILEGHENGKIYARFLGNQHGSSSTVIYFWWLGGTYTFSTLNC